MDATTVVIVGATGDLSRRKLVPALFNLWCKGRLPKGVRIVGFARTDVADDGFRDLLRVGAQDLAEMAVGGDEWRAFAQDIHYVRGSLDDPANLRRLRERLEELEGGAERANRLFYLSVAPRLYEVGVQGLGAAGRRLRRPWCWCGGRRRRSLHLSHGGQREDAVGLHIGLDIREGRRNRVGGGAGPRQRLRARAPSTASGRHRQ